MAAAATPGARDDAERERGDRDQFVELSGLTWADYERLLEIRGERAVPRLSYLDGTIEFMSPSRSHESVKSVIGRLVEVYCLERDIEFSTVGSWTLTDKEQKAGAEPDECYVIGPARETDRPDLAIEVVWTSGGVSKLEIYRRLGVRELWHWRRGRIQVYSLQGERYVELEASEVVPGIDLTELVTFLDRPTTSQAIREYRAAVTRT